MPIWPSPWPMPVCRASRFLWTRSIPCASRALRGYPTATSRCWPAFALPSAPGLNPVKVNCVLLRGFNDDQIPAFGKFAREEGVVVRFIEFMPLEEDRVWSPEIVVPLEEILTRMAEFMPLREIARGDSETARRYVFEDGVGEIGIIAPVSHPFCGHCSRVRITSDGKIRTCLFSVREHDLGAAHGCRRFRRRADRLHLPRCRSERRAPPHRRAGICSGVKDDGAYRGLSGTPFALAIRHSPVEFELSGAYQTSRMSVILRLEIRGYRLDSHQRLKPGHSDPRELQRRSDSTLRHTPSAPLAHSSPPRNNTNWEFLSADGNRPRSWAQYPV